MAITIPYCFEHDRPLVSRLAYADFGAPGVLSGSLMICPDCADESTLGTIDPSGTPRRAIVIGRQTGCADMESSPPPADSRHWGDA